MRARSLPAWAVAVAVLLPAAATGDHSRADCGDPDDAPNSGPGWWMSWPIDCSGELGHATAYGYPDDRHDWYHDFTWQGDYFDARVQAESGMNLRICVYEDFNYFGSNTPVLCQDETDSSSNGVARIRYKVPDDGPDNSLSIGVLSAPVNTNRHYTVKVTSEPNEQPTVSTLTCTPLVNPGGTVTCSFAATDDSLGVYYNVAWGDGETRRVPASGYVAPTSAASAQRVYPTSGTFVVGVTATDGDTPTGISTTRTVGIRVNAAPVVDQLSCSPASTRVDETATCTFRATDDSAGVSYTVDWGDGSPTTRVPASGTVAPGTSRTASHAWSATGTYAVSVTARDSEASPLTSAPRLAQQNVVSNAPPTQPTLACTPAPVLAGTDLSCTVSSQDDSPSVFYSITWGDGVVTRVPAAGGVAPGGSHVATHAYATAGVYSLRATATDTEPVPLTSAEAVLPITVRASATQTASSTIVLGHSQAGFGVTRFGGPNANGVDGYWMALARTATGIEPFRASAVNANVDVQFYATTTSIAALAANCATAAAAEACTVPAGAKWAFIFVRGGANVAFTGAYVYPI